MATDKDKKILSLQVPSTRSRLTGDPSFQEKALAESAVPNKQARQALETLTKLKGMGIEV